MIMLAARLNTTLPNRRRAAATSKPKLRLRRPKPWRQNSQWCSLKGYENLLPYVDINPNKSGPKWPAYVGIAILFVATIVIVALALTPR